MNKNIYIELYELGLIHTEDIILDEIRNKDGLYLYRIKYRKDKYVLKYFLNDKYLREISNYIILQNLNIPTIKLIGYTNRSLLLEDLDRSFDYRLGIESDLKDEEVIRTLAKWYKKLHMEGIKKISKSSEGFYRETDCITKENIELIKKKSNICDNKVWELILENIDVILGKIAMCEETLTYNDFYFTNLAVARDKSKSLMFDYNFLGIGFKYNDIRNVCSSLSKGLGEIFIEEYGEINEHEKIIDEGISIVIGLIQAYKGKTVPGWADKLLESVNNGELEKSIYKIINL